MRNQETRELVSKRLKEIGHRPKIQGGNGRGPTVPQMSLAAALGWEMEVVVRVGMGAGWPHHYKIDIADSETKRAVEVDGGSHGTKSVKVADVRKEEFLKSQGWTVWRFSNAEAMNTDECVRIILSGTSR